MKNHSKRGQSTLEYVIVLTAIVAAIIFAATTFIKPAMQSVYNDTNKSIVSAGTALSSEMTSHFCSTATEPD